MNYKELFIAIGLMIVTTIVYTLLRKFIHWTIEDLDRFYKRKNHFGFDKEDKKDISDIPIFKLTFGYFLIMALFGLYVINLFI